MRKKSVPYVLLIPQMLLTIIFFIGLVTGITQSLGVIPAFGLTEPTLKYYKEILKDHAQGKDILTGRIINLDGELTMSPRESLVIEIFP